MNFEEWFPDWPYLSMWGNMLKGKDVYKCMKCDNTTTWIEINFEGPLCSTVCEDAMWEEYWRASSKFSEGGDNFGEE